MSCSRTQCSDASEARTHGPSVSSQALLLSHCTPWKPADLNLHCFHCFILLKHIEGLAKFFFAVSVLWDTLKNWTSTSWQLTCPWASINFLLFPHPCLTTYLRGNVYISHAEWRQVRRQCFFWFIMKYLHFH